MLDLLSEVGGLIKIWALTIGSLSSFFLHSILNKELKEAEIKEKLSYNSIKQVSDDVDGLKADNTHNKDKISDIENQLEGTRETNDTHYASIS